MVEPSPAPPKYTTLELGRSGILTSRKESEEEDDQALVDSTAADSVLNDIGPLLSDNERERGSRRALSFKCGCWRRSARPARDLGDTILLLLISYFLFHVELLI